MNLSYWEYKSWLSNIDFTIVGSGIVGLSCALSLRKKYPKSKILVLEKGTLPQGASTKNAGFACFGSISEVLADLKHHSEVEVIELVKKRWDGIQILRKNLGDANLDFQQHGGHELFLKEHRNLYEECLNEMEAVNNLLRPVFGQKAFVTNQNSFHFNNIQENYITNQFEAQIDTGKMMTSLLKLVLNRGIQILNCIVVDSFTEKTNEVVVKTNQFEFKTKKLLIATNGFASLIIKEEVKPARAQVLITKPIENLHIKGTFHLDEGYYYFRNVDNRILFGGGRNLDFKGEETHEFATTRLIQNRLTTILKESILPQTAFEIDRSWSGIMGMGKQKQPVVKQLSNNVFCGVRLGGMGIAIGSLVGAELAHLP
jgi:gamma-glutamylputrescine oxidase